VDTGDNDLFGCGGTAAGLAPDQTCVPLDRVLGVSLGNIPSFWGLADSNHERSTVAKGPGPGGVMCCRT
jgi:hypothetical protein